MSVELPEALQQAVDAINAADTEKFVSAFAQNGKVNDWGRVLNGHDGVRSWAGSDAIGAKAQMSVTS
ncbi:nuclear transport factor 2 family protein, partial [Acaricomes phytoseiuli]|nr:nuclear transport factor 2 family protein [Acaricomes phytoseiuli]